jgi:hypothetical protein
MIIPRIESIENKNTNILELYFGIGKNHFLTALHATMSRR